MIRTSKSMMAALAALALGACDSATATDGGSGTMQVAARGDDAPAASMAPSAQGPSYATSTAQGTITFNARVYAQAASGGWVELTNGAAQQATVDAAGRGAAAVFASSQVDASTYSRVRVVFQNVNASLTSGLQVSTGLLTGSVAVTAQSGNTITVERQVSTHVSAGGSTQVLLNLNADAWMSHASATTHTVSEADFASAVQVTAQ
ncbi:MAG TPA: DUF4382 domain-containing protein [Longimicrobiaceae bacterium]|nr:DUF4382 domain-containing protein [Longimicrobiaceae bacterium]